VNTVTKADLVKTIAAEFGYSKTEARASVDAFFEALTGAIVEGHRIEARGFGAFTVKQANAKAGARNPKTGEKVYVPARRKVAFKPGRILREALSKPSGESTQQPVESNGVNNNHHPPVKANGQTYTQNQPTTSTV
jgi:nucleoid DNA-binding protein